LVKQRMSCLFTTSWHLFHRLGLNMSMYPSPYVNIMSISVYVGLGSFLRKGVHTILSSPSLKVCNARFVETTMRRCLRAIVVMTFNAVPRPRSRCKYSCTCNYMLTLILSHSSITPNISTYIRPALQLSRLLSIVLPPCIVVHLEHTRLDSTLHFHSTHVNLLTLPRR
jgi:hypothetical protein